MIYNNCICSVPSNPCADCEDYINGVCVQRCLFCETCVNGNCVSNCDVCAECTINGCQAKDCGPCETCVNGNCVFPCLACEQCDANEQCISTCGPCSQCTVNGCVSACGPCEDCVNGVCTPRCSSSQKCENGQCVALCPDCEDFINGVCTPRCVGCLTCGAGGLCVTDTTKCLDVWDEVGFYDGTRTCVKDRDCGFGYSCFRQNPNDIFGICTKNPDVSMNCRSNGKCDEECFSYDSTKIVSSVGGTSPGAPNALGSCVDCNNEGDCRSKYGSTSNQWLCDSSSRRCVPRPSGTNPSARCQGIYGPKAFYDTTLQRCVVDPNR